MSSEQYTHERLEWDGNHSATSEIAVSFGVVLSVFIAFMLAV